MKIIDLDLFKFEPIEIEGNGLKYIIKMIPAVAEIELLQCQEDVSKKMSSMKSLVKEDLDKWRAIIGVILRNNNESYDEAFHNTLSTMAVMGLMIALIKLVSGRSEAIYQIFDTKEQDEIKKKMTIVSP
jgi:hypothetical protein